MLAKHPKDEFSSNVNASNGQLETTAKTGMAFPIDLSITLAYTQQYYEKVLRLAINRQVTDENALTRVVATRSEFDMKFIKEEYIKRASVSLDQTIAKDARGDYEEMLLAFISTTKA
ncbi:annexin D1-like protein [Tanacetum coccineum]